MAKRSKRKFRANQSITDSVNIMRGLPVSALIASLEMQVTILKERGVEIRDWDNKDRTLEQIRIIGGKAYFLAAGEQDKQEAGT